VYSGDFCDGHSGILFPQIFFSVGIAAGAMYGQLLVLFSYYCWVIIIWRAVENLGKEDMLYTRTKMQYVFEVFKNILNFLERR
jgi:hypothetical protein